MPPVAERHVELVHHMPGRTRFRLSWLWGDSDEAVRIANQLAERAGILEVRVQPRTGSVLCLHEPTLELDAIVQELRRITGIEAIVRPGEMGPPPVQPPARGSAVGTDAMGLFGELDREVHRATEGRLDLATLAVVTFAGLGALNTVATGELPLPPWYSLAWWSFRVLWTVEREALRSDGATPTGAPPRSGARAGAGGRERKRTE